MRSVLLISYKLEWDLSHLQIERESEKGGLLQCLPGILQTHLPYLEIIYLETMRREEEASEGKSPEIVSNIKTLV